MIAPQLNAASRFRGGPGPKAQHGPKAQTFTIALRQPTKSCTTDKFEKLPTHRFFPSRISIVPPTARVHISSASATLARAKCQTPPTRGRPIRKWRQPRGTGTKVATRLAARSESWSAKRTPLQGNYSPKLTCYPPLPAPRWGQETPRHDRQLRPRRARGGPKRGICCRSAGGDLVPGDTRRRFEGDFRCELSVPPADGDGFRDPEISAGDISLRAQTSSRTFTGPKASGPDVLLIGLS